MVKTVRSKELEPRADGKKNRRAAIIEALRQCMLTKGYAETSITELAAGADMSASHFLYYYPTKEAVLLDLARELHDRVLTGVGVYRDEPPEERIHLLVDNMFVAMSPQETGLLRQIIAQAAHSPPLQANLEEFAGTVAEYLQDLFAQTPRQPGRSAQEAAEIAAALWMGLVINTSFRKPLDNREARRLFRRALLNLANFEAAAKPDSVAKRRTRR